MEELITKIISEVESGGKYDSYVEPYTNSDKEHTITLGCFQFYGEKAKELLMRIYEKGDSSVGSYLNFDWVKLKWKPNAKDREIIIKAISSDIGIKAQNEMFEEVVKDYILDCKEYTNDPKAIIMYSEIRHLGGICAVDRIFKQLNDYSISSILTVLMRDQKDANKNLVGSEKFWQRHLRCAEFANLYGGELMTEKEITICGHGSAKPSTKILYTYNKSRYQSLAPNGKHRCLVSVRRLKGFKEYQKFHDLYRDIIGRNIYNQNLREYCYTKYSDGNYYSDCSSSGIKTFEKIGYKFPWTLNTAGIYQSELFESVPVNIVNGHIQNPEVLRVGDCLLYIGNDSLRPLQIGHVEYVYTIPQKDNWVKDNDDWYYRESEGVNAHGWKLIQETTSQNKHWYYFDEKGKMLKGWQYINNEWFYLQENGELEGACWHGKENGALELWYV